jgi:hypothetical protein
MSSSMRFAIMAAAGSRGRVTGIWRDLGVRTVARLAGFPTIISPISTIGRPPEQPMADKPVIKIDNSIVNNFECGYHLKNAGSLSKKHADAACIVAANGGKWHEESSQGFRHQ